MAKQRILSLADTPEVEVAVESTQQFPFKDVEIVLTNPKLELLPAGTRRIKAHYFEVKAEGIDPLLVKRVEIRNFRGSMGTNILTLDYSRFLERELPTALGIGDDGRLILRLDGTFKVNVVSFVKKRPPAGVVSQCCHPTCDRPAEWMIYPGHIEACTEHVGALLRDVPAQHIFPIAKSEAASPNPESVKACSQ